MRVAQRLVLGACACSRRLLGSSVNLDVGGSRGLVGGRWEQPIFHLCEVHVVIAVLAERYGLLVVATAGLWHGGY
jgi:hypothetical protein